MPTRTFVARYDCFLKRSLEYLCEQRAFLDGYASSVEGKRAAASGKYDASLDFDLRSALTAAILHKVDACEHLRAPSPPPPPPPVVKEESVEYEYEKHKCGGKGQIELVRVPKRKRATDEVDEEFGA